MNPRKVINPFRIDENLRFGPEYRVPAVQTTLQFVEDPGGFGRTTERCIGMGKCRAHTGAMCPSYQVTREERYSTRGRAHLLHELLRGDIIRQGWQDTSIADSLEHCLSCKACKTECPTKVDMAVYKSEFMSRHYEKKRRPVSHHVFGQLGRWLPQLSRFPRWVNAVQRSPARRLINTMLGIDRDKRLPPLALESFSRGIAEHSDETDSHFYWFGDSAKPAVVLWTDSFNDHYRPTLLHSAVRVLTSSGFRVAVARQHFCCGRPLYEHGFLKQARKQLDTILDQFHRHLPANASVVVLEPSCLSVFHDELLRLLPNDQRASDLARRVTTVADFLVSHSVAPKRTLEKGILHLHCHHKSLSYTPAEKNWLAQCFEELNEPEEGCCGMAGSFGIKEKTRAIGLALFQRKLEPAINQSDISTLVIANGFSCAEQIQSESSKEVLHPIEIMERCLS